jgi:hypothetical protein
MDKQLGCAREREIENVVQEWDVNPACCNVCDYQTIRLVQQQPINSQHGFSFSILVLNQPAFGEICSGFLTGKPSFTVARENNQNSL